MSKQRLGQISANFLIVLSLFVSSVAACVCSHHTQKFEIEIPSCHEHSDAMPMDDNSNSPETIQKLSSNADCSCLQSAPRAFSKFETVKIEKQLAVLPFSPVEIKAVSTIVSGAAVYFEKPFYLSDSFYNLKSPRAPPRL